MLAFLQFLHIVDFMIMMPLGPTLMRELHLNPQQFSILISSYTFSAAISSLLFSFLSDRVDRKKSILFFFTCFSLATLGCGLVSSFWGLLGMRVMAGFFGGVMGSITLAIVGDLFDVKRRGTAMGIVMTSFSLSAIVGVPLGLIASEHWNWESPFIGVGLAAMATIPLAKFIIPAMKGHMNERPEPEEVTTFYRGLPAPLLLMGLLVFGQFAIIPFISPSLVFNAGLPNHQLPLIYITGGLCTVIGSPLIGRMSDLFGPRRIFMIAVLLSCIPMYLVTHLGISYLGIILFVAGLFFVSTSARMVPAMALIQSSFEPAFRGRLMSYVSATQQLSSALAAFVAGSVVVQTHNGNLLYYPRVGWLGIGAAIGAFSLVYLFPVFRRSQSPKKKV